MKIHTLQFLTLILALSLGAGTLLAAAPANDNFADAQSIDYTGQPVTITASNIDATREDNEPFHYTQGTGQASVWFKFTAPDSAGVRIEIEENFASNFAVYRLNNPAQTFQNLAPVRSNSDAAAVNGKYRAIFFAAAGTTYYLVLDSAFATPNTGNFALTIRPNYIRYQLDFGGTDELASIGLYRPDEGIWYGLWSHKNNTSIGNLNIMRWGNGSDTILPADFNGNGGAYFMVARHIDGKKIWMSENPFNLPGQYIAWGIAGDRALTGDYDRDGVADMVAVRQTPNGLAWFVRQSRDGSLRIFNFGIGGDNPVTGDFDGDGATDVAVTRTDNQNGSMEWHILKSGFGTEAPTYTRFHGMQFGSAGDLVAAGDFDGDGKTDIGVFRPASGTWYALRSSDQQMQINAFGMNGDSPQPADYDGDGKTDIGVFRPSDGNWYMWFSRNNEVKILHWGKAGDIPLTAANSRPQ